MQGGQGKGQTVKATCISQQRWLAGQAGMCMQVWCCRCACRRTVLYDGPPLMGVQCCTADVVLYANPLLAHIGYLHTLCRMWQTPSFCTAVAVCIFISSFLAVPFVHWMCACVRCCLVPARTTSKQGNVLLYGLCVMQHVYTGARLLMVKFPKPPCWRLTAPCEWCTRCDAGQIQLG